MDMPLLIRLQDAVEGPIYTVIRDGTSDPQACAGPLSATDLANLAKGRSVQVLVPSTEILLTRVQLPKTSTARLAKALPYALEDCVADDVEALHFAFTVQSGAVAVAVVARSLLSSWLDQLRAVGIAPDALIPDVLTVPRSPTSWSLLIDERLALVRIGDHAGFAVELEAFHGCLEAALMEAEAQPPEQLQIYCTAQPVVEALMAQRFSTTVPPVSYQQLDERHLATLLAPEPTAFGLNLLQGIYAPRGEVNSRWSAWRWSAALVVALLCTLGANEIAERGRLRAATQEADARLEGLFRKTFPETRRIVNPVAQMEQQLLALRTRQGSPYGDFLALLAEGGASLQALDGMQLERLDYQEGRLDLDLIVRDVQALDDLKRSLRAQSKLAIEILSATAADDAVRSRIRIEHASS